MDWDVMLRSEMDAAIAQRREVIGDDDFKMSVKIVGPHDEIAKTPIQWRNEDEKRRWMRALSETCKIALAQAAVVVSDVRYLDAEVFCQRFGVVKPTKDNLAEFDRQRREVMKPFDFYMGNLPRDCYTESLMVAIYGPKIARFAHVDYKHTPAGLVFEPMRETEKVQFNMLPAWWS